MKSISRLGKVFAALFCVAALYGCQRAPVGATESLTADAAESEPETKAVAGNVAPKHFFQLREGMSYGYESALSKAQRDAGAVSGQMIMFRYAGERQGLHQLHMSDGTTVTAVECTNPCEVMKIMTFIDADYLRDKVQVARYKFDVKMLAAMAMSDALSGELHQYGIERGGRKYQPWVTEAGYREHPWSGGK